MYTCQRCQKQFDPKDQNPRHLKRNPPRYCSRACGQPNRKAAVILTCRQCGRDFERKRYMADWSQERGPFCGFDCYGRWQTAHTTGRKNPNFVATSNRQGAGQIERNRLLALERDGYACRQCGSTHRLHVHHETPWEPGQTDPHALDNLVTLCASCHRKRHPMRHRPDGKFLSNRKTAAG